MVAAAMGDGGAMGGRAAAAGQGDGVSPSSYLLDFNERDILHSTGIHKQVGAPKKVRKKVHTFCVPKKVRMEDSPFFHFLFNRGIKRQYPNNRLLVQNLHTTIRRRGKKKSCNHRPH